MATIGIVCAMWSEAKPLLSWSSDSYVYEVDQRSWIQMDWEGHQVVIVVSKIGKQNAIEATQLLIQNHSPSFIVNFGSAGAVSPDVDIGDVVVASATAEYAQPSPDSLLLPVPANVLSIAEQMDGICTGPIVSADQNIDSDELKQDLFARYQAVCGDWESAVIMKVCHEYGTESFVFRVISDFGNENLVDDFKKHHKKVLTHGAALLNQYLKLWCVMD
ncbi:MAG: 5'-methylthioadenosine/S-adenosylhomocysteine nucleosidase [SAR324 cluster bacterium]|nr:5'-methylthioadenosine/S-adenosylhomocysteine nucleosidase [SAR324 cluster bacterium]